jgi:hypothetical protein
MYKAMEHNIMGSTKSQNKTFSMGETTIMFSKGRKEHIGKFLK